MVFWRDLFLVQVGVTALLCVSWLALYRAHQRKAAHLEDLTERLRIAEHGREMERLNYERVSHQAEFLRRQNDKLVDCIQNGDPSIDIDESTQ